MFIEIKLIYNVVLVLGVQLSEYVYMHIYIYIYIGYYSILSMVLYAIQ